MSDSRRRFHAALALAGFGVLVFAFANRGYLGAQLGYALRPAPPNVPVLTEPDQRPDAGVDADAEGMPGSEDAAQAHSRLWIPAIRLADVPVIYVTERNEAAYQAALKNGVAHFPGTAEPGQPGNVYLFGHSSDYASSNGRYKTVFALLPKLKAGDFITVSDRVGQPHVYAVTETFVVGPDDVSVLDQFDKQKSLLTLQTSWPLGTALKRYIVRAALVADAPAADAEAGMLNQKEDAP